MRNPERQFAFSLLDQSAVSAANFLTIMLGAAFLPLAEQGRLVTVYTLYIALVLFNIAAIFSVANVVRREIDDGDRYRYILLRGQAGSAFLAAALVALGYALSINGGGGPLPIAEAALLFTFLLVQQFVDFDRRSGYVFDGVRHAATQSIAVYGTRIGLLIYFRPETLSGFLLLMLLPALPTAIALVVSLMTNNGRYPEQPANRALLGRHAALCRWSVFSVPAKWAGLHLPILMVAALHSLEAAAILGTLRAITTFANIFLELLETIVPAWLSSKQDEAQGGLMSGSIRLLQAGTMIWIVGALLLWTAGDLVLRHALGTAYADHGLILQVIWAGNGVYFLGRVAALHFRMQSNTRIEFYGLMAGVVALPLSIPLIESSGYWGGAWCLVMVQLFTLAGLLASRRLSG